MFSHEGVELRESTVRNRYLTPPEKAGGGAGSKSSAEQVKKKGNIHMQDAPVEYIPAYSCGDS